MLGHFLEYSVAAQPLAASFEFFESLGFSSIPVNDTLPEPYLVCFDGAIAVGLHILREGLRITRRAMHGLMDRALPEHERAAIDAALAAFRQRGVQFDSLRTRVAGRGRFADLVVRVPGDWTVDRGHALLDEIESAITSAVSNLEVTTHLEPTQEQDAAGTACPG